MTDNTNEALFSYYSSDAVEIKRVETFTLCAQLAIVQLKLAGWKVMCLFIVKH